MTEARKPTLSDLIAQTPGAQTREDARASIKARRAKLLATTPPPDIAAREPMPLVDAPDEFAKAFFQRLMEKDVVTRGAKPRLVVDNKDDDKPEPPAAA